jgi:tetratricopeptide (TPR) repeat protein
MKSGEEGPATLAGRVFAITGRMASMSRREAEELVRNRGGEAQDAVTRATDVLVLGAEGLPLTSDGGVSRKLRRAQQLRARGSSIEILTEDAFLARLGLTDEAPPLYTTTQLGRILGLTGREVRRWVRLGLVAPARTRHRLDLFDFRKVAAVKAIAGLVREGVTPSRIRRSLREVGRWLPEGDEPVQHLELLEDGGELLVRLDDGRLADPRGQLRFGFGEADEPPSEPLRVREADWFEEGLRREDAGDVEGAVEAYRTSLREEGEDPETWFNLGNACYALGRREDAAEGFRCAAELDPDYVEAWNNLGNVLAELGDRKPAIDAYERALEIEPAYADAHHNLAEALLAGGRREEARRHWRAYLGIDSRSRWADHVRRRLEEASEPG